MEKPRLCFDFDGVIHKYSKGYYDGSIYDVPVDGIKEFINSLKDKYEIVVFTARACRYTGRTHPITDIKDIENWMYAYNIHFDYVTYKKVPAVAYIDDRAIEFSQDENPFKWHRVMNRIKELHDKEVQEHMRDNN